MRIQIRLAGHPAHGAERGIGDVHARVAGAQHAPRVDPAGVVRVEMNRHVHFLAQGFYQRMRRIRSAKPGHVLDRQDVRPHLHQFLGQLHVILQAVFASPGIRECRRCSRWPPRRSHWSSRAPPPSPPSCFPASSANRRCGTRRCHAPPSDSRIRSPHCPDNSCIPRRCWRARASGNRIFGTLRPKLIQPIPRVFLQKPHRRVERRPAPHLQAEIASAPDAQPHPQSPACHTFAPASPEATGAHRALSCR